MYLALRLLRRGGLLELASGIAWSVSVEKVILLTPRSRCPHMWVAWSIPTSRPTTQMLAETTQNSVYNK